MFSTKAAGAALLLLTACALPGVLLLPPVPATAGPKGPAQSPDQFARAAKAATALVDLKGPVPAGSAFCVNPSGLFLTNAHFLPPDVREVTLVLPPGEAGESTYTAAVIRRDDPQDLALLRVEGVKDLPALPIGPDAKVTELMQVWAFGHTLVPRPARSPFSADDRLTVRALPPPGAKPPRIQLNGALDPGHCGGPLLDKNGQVVGVVAGVQGTVTVIPVASVFAFAARPDVRFEPPLGPGNVLRPVAFEARVTPLLPSADPLTVELLLVPAGARGRPRPHHLKADGETYRVTAVPVPSEPGQFTLRLRAKFDDGVVEATTPDRAFKVGGREVKLNEIRGLRLGGEACLLLHDGRRFKGALTGLDAVPVKLGGDTLTVNLAQATEIECAPATELDCCTLIVKQGGKDVYGQTVRELKVLKNSSFEAGLEGWQTFHDAHNPRFEFDRGEAREGWQSLRVTRLGPPIDTGVVQGVMLKPGHWYRLSGWVKTRGLTPANAGAFGTFHVHGRRGGDVIARGENHKGDTDWTLVSFPFQTRPDDGLVNIHAFLAGFGGGTGTAWFDDVRLVELSQP
jgi:hypothetical protein